MLGDASEKSWAIMTFIRNEDGELVAETPIEMRGASAAISRARSLSATKAGAIAFSRTGDPELGEFADAVVVVRPVKCRTMRPQLAAETSAPIFGWSMAGALGCRPLT